MMVREKTPYSKVSVFLENEKSNRNTGGSLVPLWEYDFKYECENHGKNANKFWNLDKEQDSIRRLLKYKHNGNFDCDGSGEGKEEYLCRLSRDIYRKLWGWNDGDKNAEKKTRYGYCVDSDSKSKPMSMQFGPDTMNSFITVFDHLNSLLKEKGLRSEVNKKKVRDKSGGRVRVKAPYYYTLLVDIADSNPKLKPAEFLKKCSEEIAENIYISEFAVYTHALGNFVLVPAYFNNYRYIKTQDDWSRSIELLKNWETKWKYKCWGKEYSIDWRKEDFNKYINYFYLWDFVSDTNGEKSKDDLNEFNKSLDSCIKTIKRRGAFMTLMLMIQEEIGDKKFCKLRKEVFVQKEEVYKDYNSVMIEIRNNLPGVDEILNESLEACNLCEIKVL